MNNFYTAVEGKTFRGLPVYKFTGERVAIIDRSECDFDGCEFVAERDEDTMFSRVIIHPDSLPMIRQKLHEDLWHWLIDSPYDHIPAEGVMLYAGELEHALGTDADADDLQLDWPFGVPTDA